jgi:hypothetical protein
MFAGLPEIEQTSIWEGVSKGVFKITRNDTKGYKKCAKGLAKKRYCQPAISLNTLNINILSPPKNANFANPLLTRQTIKRRPLRHEDTKGLIAL